jgi:hypothetical protein
VVDFSGSLQNENSRERDVSIATVEQMRVAVEFTRVAMIKYSGSGRAEVVFHFKKHTNAKDIIAEIRATPYLGGWTNTGCFNTLS